MKMINFLKCVAFLLLPFFTCAQQIDTSQVTLLKKRAEFFEDDLQTDSARVYYQKVADIYEKYSLKELYYKAILDKVKQFYTEKNYDSVKRNTEEVYERIKKDLPDNKDLLAYCYRYWGQVALRLGNFKKALSLHEKGLQLIKEKKKPTYIELLLTLGKADALDYQGYRQKSEQLYKKGLKIIEERFDRALKKIKIIEHLFWYNLIYTYVSYGDNNKGLEHSFRAIKILNEIPSSKANTKRLLDVYYNQAGCYKNTHRYKDALRVYKKCIRLQNELNPADVDEISDFTLRIGNVYLAQSKSDSAVFYIQKAINYLLKKYEATHVKLADAYYILAFTYTKQEKYDLANENYSKALSSLKNKYGKIHPNLVLLYLYMGINYLSMEKPAPALEAFQVGLMSNMRNFKNPDLYAIPRFNDYYNLNFFFGMLIGKGIAFGRMKKEKIKNLKASLQHFRAADNFIKEVRRRVSRKNDQLLIARNISEISSNSIFTCEQLYNITHERKYLDEAFYFAERDKASLLLKSQAEANAKKFGGIPSDLLAQEKKLRTEIATYQRKLLLNKKEELRDSLAKANQAYEVLTKRFEQRYPKYAQIKFDLKLATPTGVQASLDAQTALLEYTFCHKSVYLVVITKRNYQLIRIPEVKKVQAQLEAYYEAIQSESRLRKFAPVSHQLYQTLVQPAKKYLDGIKKLVVVAPSLESNPFEALITQLPANLNLNNFAGIHYLNKQYQISYHYSATLWQKEVVQKAKQHSNTIDFIGFAPFSTGESKIYTTTRGTGDQLPESGIELKKIYNLFEKSRLNAEISLSKTATKELFIQKMAKARIVHIASHSEANTQKPGLAKVRFSGCGGRTQDVSGCLLASEIYNLEMNADLLVLSSCSSGVGKLTKGEGIFSLARSFLYAGAHNVVFSLWDVDDEYTKKLMIAFYKHFLSNPNSDGYQKALQLARNQLAEQNIHPKHWAGIVLIGK
ncbi:hypothetical protein BKI52_06415 [marine bacterium AO1-C]|nr:hypothetical protein BKI52_06415 [marine bacterium AO1-C]